MAPRAQKAAIAGLTAVALFGSYLLFQPKNQVLPKRKVSMSQSGTTVNMRPIDFDRFNNAKGQWLQ